MYVNYYNAFEQKRRRPAGVFLQKDPSSTFLLVSSAPQLSVPVFLFPVPPLFQAAYLCSIWRRRSVRKNAEKKMMCNGYIIDTMLSYVKELTAKGKPIEYECDGRIKIFKGGKEL